MYRNEVKDPNILIDDLNNISKFVDNINKVFKDLLLFKIHPLDYKKSFSYLNYFKKNHKHLKIIIIKKNLETLMSQSRLSVFLFGHRFFEKSLNF